MSEIKEKVNKYLAVNVVEGELSSLVSDKKSMTYCECCVEPLVEEAYIWDSDVRRFRRAKD